MLLLKEWFCILHLLFIMPGSHNLWLWPYQPFTFTVTCCATYPQAIIPLPWPIMLLSEPSYTVTNCCPILHYNGQCCWLILCLDITSSVTKVFWALVLLIESDMSSVLPGAHVWGYEHMSEAIDYVVLLLSPVGLVVDLFQWMLMWWVDWLPFWNTYLHLSMLWMKGFIKFTCFLCSYYGNRSICIIGFKVP